MAARLSPLAVESCPLAGARGRVLARDVRTDRDSPAFDHAAMDGYAIRTADLPAAPATLTVVEESRPGRAAPPLPPGPLAVRIATGAPLPAGADAVIPREQVIERHAEPRAHQSRNVAPAAEMIELTPAARATLPGANIRRRGENAPTGTVLASAGTLLTPAAIAALGACGCAVPEVFRRLKVAILTTGDEVVPIHQVPDMFQVRDSNGPVMHALLSAHAWLDADPPVHVADNPGALADAIRAACRHADALVITGGVSMGDRDHTSAAVAACGGEIVFHRLPQRPGKPVLGALIARSESAGGGAMPVLALPGNPVSAAVVGMRLALPVLAAGAGMRSALPPLPVPVANPDGQALGLWWYRLVRLTPAGAAELLDTRSSGDVVSLARSDGFIEIPPRTPVRGGDERYAFYAWPR